MKSHRPIWLSLAGQVFHEEVFVAKPHQQWTFPSLPKSQAEWEQRENLCRPVLQKSGYLMLSSTLANSTLKLFGHALPLTCSTLSNMHTKHMRGTLPTFKKRSIASRNAPFEADISVAESIVLNLKQV